MNELVRQTRDALNLSQQEMTDALGCSFSTERRCEREGRLPKNQAVAANLCQLARKVDIDISQEAKADQKRS